MRERTNQDVIRIVNKWQRAGFVNEMTCAINGCGRALEPIERQGQVLLQCPGCGYEQARIPEVVLASEAKLDETARAMTSAQAALRERRRMDLLFSLVACGGGGAFFGSWVHPLWGTSIGLILGTLIAWLAHRQRS